MIYQTKTWELEAFPYDPYGYKADWFIDMIKNGEAFEFAPYRKKDFYHATFGNKRGTYVALVGDYICKDQFGHVFVWSAKTFGERCG